MQRGSAIVEVKVIAFSASHYIGTVDEGSTFNRTVDVKPPVHIQLDSLLHKNSTDL